MLSLSGVAAVVLVVASFAGFGGDTPGGSDAASKISAYYDSPEVREMIAAFVLAAAPFFVLFAVTLAESLSVNGRRMTFTHRPQLNGLLAAALGILVLAVNAAPSGAAGETKAETLRIFSQPQNFTYTTADGKVSHHLPAGQPQPGDVLEVDSLDFKGNHKRHSKHPIGSDYTRCSFVAVNQEPDCFGYGALGGSVLRVHNSEIVGGAGRYEGVTGTVPKNDEVRGGSDVVMKLRLE
jgi:hypothetical protein